MDAVKKLNEIKNMKGLGRFFKQVGYMSRCILDNTHLYFHTQVAQSARSGDGGNDDFLGGIDIPMREVPVQGLDRWYKLEGKNICTVC